MGRALALLPNHNTTQDRSELTKMARLRLAHHLFALTELLLWLIPLTLKFPKSQRFLLAERLSGMVLDFYDLIIAAVQQPQGQAQKLDEADRLLTQIRLYVRLSHDLQCLNLGQFEHAARQDG